MSKSCFVADDQRFKVLGNCETCPLHVPRPVWGKGKGGGVAVVGESPGTNEVRKGEPFIGVSGQLLRTTLKQCGVDPDDVYFANATLCHSPSKPEKGTIVACNDRLWNELAAVRPDKILLVGAAALQAAVSPAKPVLITKERGRLFWTEVAGRQVLTMATWHPAAVLRTPDYFRDFARDVARLVQNSEPYPIGEPDVFIAWTEAEALEWIPQLEQASAMGCDIETSGLSSVDDRQLSIGFAVRYANRSGGASFIFPCHLFKFDRVREGLARLVFRHHHDIVFHNGKFDLKFLRRDIENSWPIHYADTLLMHYVLDERGGAGDRDRDNESVSKGGSHKLKVLSRIYFDVPDYSFDFDNFYNKEDKTIDDWKEFFTYQGKDCYYTLMLYEVLGNDIDDLEAKDPKFRGRTLLENVLYPAARALTEIETTGAVVDLEYLKELETDIQQRVIATKEELVRLVDEGTHGELDDFNANSYVQVKKLIYDTWKYPVVKGNHKTSGEATTSSTVLSRFHERETDPVKQRILSLITGYRHETKFLSTYAIGLQRAADSDSRIRTGFLLAGTSTGRLSSSGPNLQNIPSASRGAGSSVQRAFTARPGYSLIEADYSQLELRVLAHISGDENLIQVYKDDKDIHAEVSQILGIPRGWAKIFVFGLVYGRSPAGIINGEEMNQIVAAGGERWTVAKATAFQARFLSAYPKVQEWLELTQRQALTLHYVETLWGHRRRFPFITNQTKSEIMRQGANMPIQGTASTICLAALVRLQTVLPEGAVIWLTVHDSIVFEVRDDLIDEVIGVIEREMTENVPLVSEVPFKIDIKVGKRWGELAKLEPAQTVAG